MEPAEESGLMPEGTHVAVRNRFDGAWCSGFAVAEVATAAGGDVLGYRLRRTSDPSWILPAIVPVEDVSPASALAGPWTRPAL